MHDMTRNRVLARMPSGRGEPRLQHAALARHPFVEIAEQPLVDVQLGVEGLEVATEGDPQQPGIGHVVDRAPRLVVRPRSVEPHVISLAAERQVDAIGPGLRAAVAVQEIMERPLAAGHQPEEELARAGAGLLDVLIERRQHGGRAVAAEQLAQTRLGKVAGRHHRARIALHEIGQARVAEKDPIGLLVQLSLAHDSDRRDEQALVVDLGGMGRDASGAQPADVLVVAERRGEGDGLPVVEDGDDEDHVLMVLDGAVGDVGIVEPVDVARPHAVERVRAQDGLEHAGSAARDVTRDDAPARVEQCPRNSPSSP